MSDKPRSKPNRGWFPEGRSPNPKGRPAGTRAPQDSVLEVLVNTKITVTGLDGPHEMSTEEAIQWRIYQAALAGKAMAIREVTKWIIKYQRWLAKHAPKAPTQRIAWHISPDPDNADEALVLLGIAAHNPARADIGASRAQLLLEPWAVQAAFGRRRGGSRLNDSEREAIRRSTRDADSLCWPRGADR